MKMTSIPPSNNNLNDYGTSIKEIDFFGQYFFLLFPNIPSSSFASFSPPLSPSWVPSHLYWNLTTTSKIALTQLIRPPRFSWQLLLWQKLGCNLKHDLKPSKFPEFENPKGNIKILIVKGTTPNTKLT